MSKKSNFYCRYRFPAEIISYCVWIYNTFPLSYRDVEQMMPRSRHLRHLRKYSGVVQKVWTALCQWDTPPSAPTSVINGIKGEVVITIDGQKYYLWRAVDLEGNVLDILMQSRRDTKAAKKFFRNRRLRNRVLRLGSSSKDKLKSYGAAKEEILIGVERSLLIRGWTTLKAEFPPTDSAAGEANAQVQVPCDFSQMHEFIRGHFHPKQHLLTASEYRHEIHQRFEIWRELVGINMAA